MQCGSGMCDPYRCAGALPRQTIWWVYPFSTDMRDGPLMIGKHKVDNWKGKISSGMAYMTISREICRSGGKQMLYNGKAGGKKKEEKNYSQLISLKSGERIGISWCEMQSFKESYRPCCCLKNLAGTSCARSLVLIAFWEAKRYDRPMMRKTIVAS